MAAAARARMNCQAGGRGSGSRWLSFRSLAPPAACGDPLQAGRRGRDALEDPQPLHPHELE